MTYRGTPRARASSVGALVVAVLLSLCWTAPARADYVSICSGYTGCSKAGYGNAGYRSASGRMYWRMYSGHNCTNYVAYRMVKAGLPNTRPWSGSGNAENWGRAMSSITDDTPMVGAVAWWARNIRPVSGSVGHVAYVERVVSSREIWISEDSWGGDFHWRRVTRSGSGWPSGFIHFRDVALRSKTAPTITGDPKVGETLTASPGSWTPAATSYAYQWLVDGSPIAGATASTFVVNPGRLGRQLSVQVSATGTGYAGGQATSSPTPSVGPGTLATAETPAISGEALVGSVLTASRGSWTPAVKRQSIQWLADGTPIADATGWTLPLQPAQAGTVVSAVVTATRKGYEPSTVTAPPTETVLGGEVTVTSPFELTGIARLGERLTVSHGTFEPADAALGYTWLRDGVRIRGARGATYDLGPDDVGARISALVDLSHAGYKPVTRTTGETVAVHTVPQLRVATRGGRRSATVTVTVVAPGVATPTGSVRVRVGPRNRTVNLRGGGRTVRIRQVPPGSRKVVVRYLGRDLVDAGVFRDRVRVLRP